MYRHIQNTLEPDITLKAPGGDDKWISLTEAAQHTPYSAEYLSLLARKGKLVAKKIDNTWYTTRTVLEAYMRKQMLRQQVQNGEMPTPRGETPTASALTSAAITAGIKEGFFSPRVIKSHLANKTVLALIIVSVAFFTILPIPFVFSSIERGLDFVKGFTNNANSVMGYRPGTHANELLLLDKSGNIAITGHIETYGQLVSHAPDGTTPIVVDSRTLVKNLNAEYLGSLSSADFTLAFVTSNGAVTTEDVQLEGNVEVGKTLNVRGATGLDGDLQVLGNAEFSKILKVVGPAEFESVVKIMNDLNVTGTVSAGSARFKGGVEANTFTGSSGSFNLLYGGKLSSPLATIASLIAEDVSTNALTADEASTTALYSASSSLTTLTFVSATGTSATTTNFYSDNASFSNLVGSTLNVSGLGTFGNILALSSSTLQNFTAQSSTSTSATSTNFFTTTGSTTNLFFTNASGGTLTLSGIATFPNLLLNGSTTLQDFTFRSATGTSATTTNFFATTASSTNFFATTINGQTISSSATLTGTLSVLNGLTTLANLQANSSTTLQNFTGSNATVTNATTTGDLSVGSNFVVTLLAKAANLLITGSSTLQNFTSLQSTSTNATTTSFFSTVASSTNLFATALSAGASTFNGTVTANSGLTTLLNLLVTSSSTLQNFTFLNATGTTATTTNFYSANGFFDSGNVTTLISNTFTTANITDTGLAGSGTRCLQTDNTGLISIAAGACGTGGSGSGGGTWATTTSQVDGEYINYSMNNTDIVTVGNVSTTTAPIYFDPNIFRTKIFNQYFGLSSTTLQNFTGSNATVTNATTTGDLSVGSNFVVTLLAKAANLLITGSSTLQNFTFTTATGTNATTTNFFATTASTTNLFFSTGSGGSITSSGLGTFQNILSLGSSTLQNFTFQNATGTSATTTNLYTSGQTILAGTGGNVGIGTTTPGGLFEAYQGSVQTSGTHFLFNAANGSGTNDADVFTINSGRATAADELNLFRITTASGDVFNVRQNGRVGIGKAAPSTLLDVAGTASSTGLQVNGNTNITGTLLVNSSSTLQNFTGSNSTSTQATTTSLYISGTASTTQLFANSATIGTLVANTANLTESGNLFYTDVRVNSYIHASTTIPKTYTGNTFTGAQIFDSITRSTTTQATSTNLFSTTASTTNLFGTSVNGFGLTSCTGGTNALRWSNGSFSCVTNTDNTASSTLLTDNNSFTGLNTFTDLRLVTRATTTNATTTNQFIQTLSFVTGSTTNLTALSSTTLQNFTFTTATGTSATTTNFFATTASTTNLFFTTSNGGAITSSGLGTFQNILSLGSSTLQNFTGSNSTTSNATSTNFFTTTGSTTNLFFTNASGGTLTLSGIATFPNLLVTGSSTLQNFTGSNSTTSNATSTSFFATNASTTNLFGSTLNFDNGTLFVDSTNHRVGISSTSPITTFAVQGIGTTYNGNTYLGTFAATGNSGPQLLLTGNGSYDGRDWSIISAGSGNSSIGAGKFAIADRTINLIRFIIDSSGNVGIGTTTPNWLLNLSTSTRPQLTLSDPSTLTNNHWSFRNAGGLLYIATSSPTTFATSTSAALSINNNGTVSIANLLSSTYLLASGSSTLQNFTFQNATGTSATTTNFFATTASSTNLYATTITSGLINGQTIGSVASFTGTLTATGGLTTLSNLLLTSSTTLQNFTASNSTSTNATTTSLAVSGTAALTNTTNSGTLVVTGATTFNNTVTASTSSVTIQSTSAIGNSPNLILQNTTGSTPNTFGPGIKFDNGVAATHGFIVTQNQSAASDFAIRNLVSPFDTYLSIAQGGAVTLSGNLVISTTTATSTLSTGGLTIGTSQFVVQQGSGNVGLGTTNPTEKLALVDGNFLQTPGAPVYKGGIDISGSLTGTGSANINKITVAGRYAYVAVNSTGGVTCGSGAGNALGCNLQIYDVSTSTPTYLGGVASDGTANGGISATAFQDVAVSGHYAYVLMAASSTACSSSVGTGAGNGCELKIFDVADPTNPKYLGGADNSGSTNSGTSAVTFKAIRVVGRYAYIVSNNSGSTCSNTTGTGCELKIFDISDPANPMFVGGGDSGGATAGDGGTTNSAYNNIYVSGSYAYITKAGAGGTTCSQTPGSASGCALQVWDISNPRNPTYLGGAASNGFTNSGDSVTAFNDLWVQGRWAFVTMNASSTACSNTPSSAGNGCELKIFDVATSSTPTLVSGLDNDGTTNGGVGVNSVNDIFVSGRYAYLAQNNSTTACSQVAGSATGCELKIVDISDPTNPLYVGGVDANGAAGGNQGVAAQFVFVSGRNAYVGFSGNVTACTQVAPASTGAGAIGCELKIYDVSGFDITSLFAGTLETGNAQVRNDLIVSGQGKFNSVNAGFGGIYSNGPLSVFTASTTASTPISASFMGGNVGIGTVVPNYLLEVNGTASTTGFFATRATTTNATTTNFFTTTSSSTNLFSTALNTGLITSGNVNGQTISSAASFSGTVNVTTSITNPILIGGSGAGSTLTLQTTSGTGVGADAILFKGGSNGATEFARFTNLGYFGIGTTTPQWQLQLSSSTRSQLTLSDPSTLTNNHWSFRNAGGNFYLATSSPSTFATSTIPALSIISGGISGYVGIGTAVPGEKLEVVGNIISAGTDWSLRTAPENNGWRDVTFGNGIFVAVGHDTSSNRVMWSADGINWATTTSANTSDWQSVTYGNGLFVAVAETGGLSSVMTSPDGINWATSTAASASAWFDVVYGENLFVAVATGGQVMTSPDGLAWTTRTGSGNGHRSVTYGAGQFVAVGDTNRVMTSPNGITWTNQAGASGGSDWYEVAYGNGLFVAVGTGGKVMTSTDGVTWTSRTSALASSDWLGVTYGAGLFVAVSSGATVMTSPDGITWTLRSEPGTGSMHAVAYGNGIFVIPSYTNTDIITSGKQQSIMLAGNNIYQGNTSFMANVGIGTSTPRWALQVSGTSTPQLTLSDSGLLTSNHWSFRNAGGTFYLSTSSPTTFATSSTAILTIDKNGSLGISSTTPFATLSVNPIAGQASNQFVVGSSTATNFIINNSGSVGIGTTSPSTFFSVGGAAGNVTGHGYFTGGLGVGAVNTTAGTLVVSGSITGSSFSGTANTNSSLYALSLSRSAGTSYTSPDIYAASTGLVVGGTIAGGGTIAFNTTSGTTPTVYLNASGNVGIGTINPGQNLTVAKGVAFMGIANGAGTAYVCTTLATGVLSTSTSACNTSSIRFKDNVQDLSYGLDDVMRLRAVSFDYKPELLVTGHQIGFIAEEMEGVIPEVVGYDAEGKPANIDYAKLTSVLAKSIQELNAKIDSIASSTIVISTSTPGFVASVLETIGATIVDGVTKFVALVVDNLSTYALTVGKPEKPAGITIYDEDTGMPYCMKVKSGQQISVSGECGSAVAAAPSSGSSGSDATFTPIEIVEPTASSTETTSTTTEPTATEPESTASTTETTSTTEPTTAEVPASGSTSEATSTPQS